MLCGKKTSIIASQLFMVFFATCALTTAGPESRMPGRLAGAAGEKYADLLVDPALYTTSGAVFQKKYYRLLIGVAAEFVEKMMLSVQKGSIGFYYDKRSGDRERLYLGLDLAEKGADGRSFDAVAADIIMKHLTDIVKALNSCRSIFNEKGVAGAVIGWIWTSGNGTEHLSVWIAKEDLIRFEEGMITFNELVQRSSITNTAGRVIRLQLFP
jgi:hypothetical protein